MKSLSLVVLFCCLPLAAQTQTINLVFLGDSLTEGVPHFAGETDTAAFPVAQAIPGSTYVKLGYRGQTTDYLRGRMDGWLTGLYKDGWQNVLVLWGGTNDCAVGTLPCVQSAYANLVAISRVAHAAGWQVVALTMIARATIFSMPPIKPPSLRIRRP